MSSNTGQSAQPPPAQNPPYPPAGATLGGIPTPLPDIPISAVLLALFALSAGTHLALFLRNKRRGAAHRFFFSFLLFVFSCLRVVALALRIAWSRAPRNASLALAAAVFTAAGVMVVFIVNLVLARRVVRGLHPAVGWHGAVTQGVKVLLGSVVAMLIMVVVCSVHSMFTLDMVARGRERDVVRFAGVYITVIAFLPAVAVSVAWLVPNRSVHRPEGFGKGGLGAKVLLLLGASLVLTLGAGFRAGVNFAVRPAGQEQWYHSKPAFYCFNFVVELLVAYSYAIFRFDRMFHVPEGSSAPGHYSGGGPGEGAEEPGFRLDASGESAGDSNITLYSRNKPSGGREGDSAA
ncbi:hypothetical protein CHGG_08421 [Chaetomium globosum CBS 148.51]|uniref:Uncharacterized protein n=1 Tax=Chaetomium globosum (strain ATCC 6205 / CBS 148.51 / DSM 1962 / NBRC 6347 / NRRL 1970) TaxID=306901 RepID=Q2GUD3_CHAGB|nr:uncharacterized protein CHGG_08421 [Chaetomium globosum CBS 148.51]EAQ84407.1 hypothetical protein CHGG_08421 [Chaetomium globosum CBS 148.51]